MDEIIEDVQHAHDMLEAAIYHAGHDPHAAHPHGAHNPEQPAHTGRRVPG